MADRFARDGRPAARGERARAQLPDAGLARAAHAADGDPRARGRASRGPRRRARSRERVARRDRRGGGSARAAGRRRARPGQAGRAPVHGARGGGRHGPRPRARLRGVRRGGAAARDRLPPARQRRRGDRDTTATACCRSSPTCSRTPSGGRPTAGGSTSSSTRENGDVAVAVADTRAGHLAEEAERIFRPFWSRDGGGTGLGLAIARELANALGGTDRARQHGRPGQPLQARPSRSTRVASRLTMSLPQRAERRRARTGRPAAASAAAPVRAALVALRPRQWSKNLLLFAGILFAGELGDATRWARGCAIFAAYCAASSAAYLVNDVRDAPATGCIRSSASGRSRAASSRVGRRSCSRPCAGVGAFALAFALGPGRRAAARAVPGAPGRVHVRAQGRRARRRHGRSQGSSCIRAAAGAEAVDVRISPWLLLCTASARALPRTREAPRRARACRAATRRPAAQCSRATRSRSSISWSRSWPRRRSVAYSLYTFGSVHSAAMMATIPFVVFGALPLPAADPPGRPRRGARAHPADGPRRSWRPSRLGADRRRDPRAGSRR